MAFVYVRNGFYFAGWTDEFGGQRKKKTNIPAKTGKDGKPIQKYYQEAYALAKSAEDNSQAVYFGQDAKSVSQTTYRQLCAQYLEVYAKRLRSFKDIKHRLETFVLPFIGDKYLGQIRPIDVMMCLNKAREMVPGRKGEDKASPQLIQHVRNHISATFKFAIKVVHEVDTNPVAQVPNEVIPDPTPKVISPELIPVIVAHVAEQWRGPFAVAVYTGMRKGEILALKFSDIDLDAGLITVARSGDSSTTKGKHNRFLPIHPELEPYLRVEFGRRRSEYIFPAKDGGRRHKDVKLQLRLREALRRAGIVEGYNHKCRRKGCGFMERRADDAPSKCPRCNFTLHVFGVAPKWCFKDLRSTFGTLTYEATGDLRIVQRFLGHADLETTEKAYAKLRERRMAEELKKLKYPTPHRLPDVSGGLETEGRQTKNVVRIQRDIK